MKSTPVESVCVFGSAARGTADGLSDKDVLIVAGDSCRGRQLAQRWAASGWSVAAYSPSRIQAMTCMGSLFVQHIKREGVIIADRGSWLTRLLDSAKPKQCYETDFILAAQMLKPLERLALGYWSRLMAADLGFIFIRNAGIYALAQRGIYEFDYARIVKGLAEVACLTNSEVSLLQRLRVLKTAYRLRDNTLSGLDYFDALPKICAKVAQIDRPQKLPDNAPVRLFPVRYATLRDVEARMIMQFDINVLDHGDLGDDLSVLWKMVTTPREYSWKIREIDPAWITAVNNILAGKSPSVKMPTADRFPLRHYTRVTSSTEVRHGIRHVPLHTS